jgi:DNA-damage-inducible protein J
MSRDGLYVWFATDLGGLFYRNGVMCYDNIIKQHKKVVITMPDTTVTIRIDEKIKKKFEDFCSDVGINMSVAVNMFIRASLKEQRIPFLIKASKQASGLALLEEMRAEAEERGFLSDEQISAEVLAVRADKNRRSK